MTIEYTEIASRGRTLRVPSVRVNGLTVFASGRLFKMAEIRDEEFVDGGALSGDPVAFITQLRRSGLRADVLTFAQNLYEGDRKYPFPFEWDNAAVADTTSYERWWEGLPQESRKNARKAAKRGVSVRIVTFDDEFVRGIKAIYDEMPVRQGRRFWHFGKDFNAVKEENATYLDSSEFLGAYVDGELVGFMKYVYVGRVAAMMQILSKSSHYDKRPMNALIAKAVEVCHSKGVAYLAYSKFTYGNKTNSQIAEFKKRNGFVQMNFPRYYVPLTLRGKVAVGLKLHRGLLGVLPPGVISLLWRARSAMMRVRSRASDQASTPGAAQAAESTSTSGQSL